MKNYTITVNGNVYDVTVEEKGAGAAPAAPKAPAAPAPKAAPAPAAPKAAGAGRIQVKAGAAGKVYQIPDISRTERAAWRYGRCHRSDENGDPGRCPGSGNHCQH